MCDAAAAGRPADLDAVGVAAGTTGLVVTQRRRDGGQREGTDVG